MKVHRIAISQSNFIPWRGYFDLIRSVDEFVIYDEAQFTRRDWRNRNLIKTPNGQQWLTVPVKSKGNYDAKISEIEVLDSNWREKHWASIEFSYSKAEYFGWGREWLGELFEAASFHSLSSINSHFLVAFLEQLDIRTPLLNSVNFQLAEDRNERLLNICLELGATHYVSGPSAKSYLDEGLFLSHGIVVEWFNFEGYEPYPQEWGAFLDKLSIVDLFLNCGPESFKFLRKGGGK